MCRNLATAVATSIRPTAAGDHNSGARAGLVLPVSRRSVALERVAEMSIQRTPRETPTGTCEAGTTSIRTAAACPTPDSPTIRAGADGRRRRVRSAIPPADLFVSLDRVIRSLRG